MDYRNLPHREEQIRILGLETSSISGASGKTVAVWDDGLESERHLAA